MRDFPCENDWVPRIDRSRPDNGNFEGKKLRPFFFCSLITAQSMKGVYFAHRGRLKKFPLAAIFNSVMFLENIAVSKNFISDSKQKKKLFPSKAADGQTPIFLLSFSLCAHIIKEEERKRWPEREQKRPFSFFRTRPRDNNQKTEVTKEPFFLWGKKEKMPLLSTLKETWTRRIFCQCEDGKRIMLFCNLEKNSCNLLMRKKNSNCNLANLKIQNEGGFLWSDWIFEILWDSQSLSFPFVFKAQSKVGVFFVRLIIFVSLGKTKKSVFLRWKATKFCFESTKESFTMRW